MGMGVHETQVELGLKTCPMETNEMSCSQQISRGGSTMEGNEKEIIFSSLMLSGGATAIAHQMLISLTPPRSCPGPVGTKAVGASHRPP
ncbi:hypothetical protein V6N11_053342 [Hibiscus sabdariffa]|uniref:Uncharacterized protein n=1 Tax=Hibiscus sabdariffa TaxID=183260 RepID=A0ABR2UCT1_9ROSI